jgi:hypothetical protein
LTALDDAPDELTAGEAGLGRSEHKPRQGRGCHRRVRWLGRGPAIALVVHAVAALALMPVAGHPYDLAALTTASGAWLRWGVPLFYHWKFGFDLSMLAIGAQSFSYVLEHLGLSGAAALTAAWKLPLVLADLLVGVLLVDLGRQLRCPRPGLIPTLWLISPVSLWVSAGHGQIESLAILAIVLSLDLLVRRRPLAAGVVVGLGIGIEYLPVLVSVVVAFWFCSSFIARRDLYRFAAGGAAALVFCFGPPLATDLGRTSLAGGLSFTASVASNAQHTKAAPVASSLWAIFNLSPGKFWLLAALSASVALMIVLMRRARRDATDRKRLGVLAAGGLLLCLTLLDPGALPQFSALVLAGLSLIGLCVDLNPVAIVLGPSLQLAAGFFYVYGGSFQSFWYDMWVKTGTSGWPFPQSAQLEGWAARLGAVVVALGLLFVSSRMLGAGLPARARIVTARSAIVAGALGTAFLAIWSLQPVFWHGVGSQGPATLADFTAITATEPGNISITAKNALITFPSTGVLAARESAVSPSLMLTAEARPFFAQTEAKTAKFGRSLRQTLTIPDWKRERKKVDSLWVSTLIGTSSWRTRADAVRDVPALVAGGVPFPSSSATWVAPGWSVVTYNVSASRVSPVGKLRIGLDVNRENGDIVAWNGDSHVRWVLVSLHSGVASATIDNRPWQGPVTLSPPTPSWWFQRMEQASIEVALKPRTSVSIARASIGGQNAAIVDGSFQWPTSGGLDDRISTALLFALGVVDVVVLIGGGLVLGRRTTKLSSHPFELPQEDN